MATRVTQGMINTQLLRNLNSNLSRMNDTQNQLATGRRINKPSDDPVGISFSMRYRSEISANNQYMENVDSALSWLEFTDSTLDQTGSILQRARELSVQAANGTNPQESLDSIASEVDQLYEQLITLGNSEFNGKYVFNGEMTDVKPYSKETASVDTTDTATIQFEIGAGVKIPVNVTGDQVFGASGADDNAFKLLDDLRNSLRAGDTSGVQNVLGKLDSRVNSFLEIRADVGAKTNRIQLSEDRLKDININMQTLQSQTEDADLSELITTLKTDENVYQASLAVGSKIIRPSLIDFLR